MIFLGSNRGQYSYTEVNKAQVKAGPRLGASPACLQPSPLFINETAAPLSLGLVVKIIGDCLDDLNILYPCQGPLPGEEDPAGNQPVHDVQDLGRLDILPRLGNGQGERFPARGSEG